MHKDNFGFKPRRRSRPLAYTCAAALGVTLAALSAHATLSVTNGSFGTVNRNGQYVDGGGWFESTITVSWVEGSWANPGSFPATFPSGSGMACLFDGAQTNGYIYQKLGTVDAADLAAGILRITSDFAEKADDTTVIGTFSVYAGAFPGAAHGTDIAGAGLTQLFATNLDAAAQGLTAAAGDNSRVTSKSVGDVNLAGLGVGTEIWLRIGRPSSGAGDFIVDNVAAQLVTPPLPPASLLWQGDGTSNLWNVAGAPNWSNGSASVPFNQGDNVVFGDSGSATPAVNLALTVLPSSLLVSNVTRDYTFAGAGTLSGAVTLVKTGSGTLTLQTADDNAGGELINGGTLRVSGGTVGLGALVVNAGATATGSGSHRGPVTLSGTIAPGDGPGTLTTGPQTWNSGGVCVLEIQSATNSAAQDFLNLTGPLNVQATPANPFVIRLVSLAASGSPGPVADFDPTRTYTWWVANPFGGVSNAVPGGIQLDSSAFSNPLAGGQFNIAVAGNSLIVQFTPAPPPPPSLTGQPGAGGAFALTSFAQPGQYQTLLAASNLTPPVVWIPVSTNLTGSNGLVNFTLAPDSGPSQQFYRSATFAPEVISVTNFGLQPNIQADATVPVQQAVAAIGQRAGRPTILSFPNGRYDFYPTNAARVLYYISNTASESENPDPTKTIGIWLKGLTNVIVDGNGSLLVFHGKMTTLVLDQCQDVEVRNLHEDFARPTVSEVKVTALSGSTMDVDVNPDSAYSISGGKLTWVGEGWTSSNPSMTQEYDPQTDTTWRNGWNPVSAASNVQELAPFKLRLTYGSAPSAQVGHGYQMRDTIRDQVGVFIHESRNITLRNSGFHFTHGLGIVGQYTENLTLDTVQMEPRAESGRTCAAFADFFQVSGCRGKVTVWNSRFVGAQDDPINTHGTHLRIIAQPAANQVQVRFMHPQSYGFDAFFPGDQVDFIKTTTLTVLGSCTVQAVQRLDPRNILLTLDRSVPAGVTLNTDCVENVTWTPALEVRGCWFSRYPTRGILATTRRPVVIERNVFNRSPMPGILIADDAASWYESGMVTDVLIRENQFFNCSSPVIQLQPENTTVDINNPVHSNVRIQQNLFRLTGSSLLSAKSTELLRFEANRVQCSPVVPASSLISFNACRNSTVTNNVMEPY
jgi:autotransporter-associated beta strand protein